MPVNKHIEQDLDLTVLTFSGKVTFEEMMEMVHELFEAETITMHNLYRGKPEATIAHFTKEQMAQAARDVAGYTEGLARRKGGKTAIVAPEDVDFGLSRMLQSLLTASESRITYEIRVFRSEDEARRWIER